MPNAHGLQKRVSNNRQPYIADALRAAYLALILQICVRYLSK